MFSIFSYVKDSSYGVYNYVKVNTSEVIHYVQDTLPSTRGALTHSVRWLLSGSTTIIHENPQWIGKKGKAIMIVHGFCDHVSAGVPLANNLKVILFGENAIPNLNKEISSIQIVSFTGRGKGLGIDDYATQLRDHIRNSGETDIIFIPHSRGGLVCSDYERRYAEADGVTVHAIIPVCTPYGGSYLALAPLTWYSTSVKQMQPGSVFLRDLCAYIRNSKTKYFFVAAERDLIVAPRSSCIEESLDHLTTFKKEGHLSIMASPVFFEYVLKCLLTICAPSLSDEDALEAISSSISQSQIDPHNDFILIDKHDISPEIADMYYELDIYIAQLKQSHASDAVRVLEQLRDLLAGMLMGERGDKYPECQTVDEWMNRFLVERTTDNNYLPAKDILSTPINYSYLHTLFYGTAGPQPKLFIEELIHRYHGVLLPTGSNHLLKSNKASTAADLEIDSVQECDRIEVFNTQRPR